jgi:hypothetical protein
MEKKKKMKKIENLKKLKKKRFFRILKGLENLITQKKTFQQIKIIFHILLRFLLENFYL